MADGLSTPAQVQSRLEAIEDDLATKQNAWEDAAMSWFKIKREREKAHALAFLTAEGSVAERNARADAASATIGAQEEALYEALKAVVRTLETRASIGQSILRSQARVA